MTGYVILFRAINAGVSLPMAEARACIAAAGFVGVRSYIASGNLLVEGEGGTAEVEARIEAAIAATMDRRVEAIARTAAEWAALVAANPLPDAARDRPKLLHLLLSKHPLRAGAADAIAARAASGEVVAEAGGALWIDFGGGVARSKLTSRLLDKAAGSTVTARNWNTVLKLAGMVG